MHEGASVSYETCRSRARGFIQQPMQMSTSPAASTKLVASLVGLTVVLLSTATAASVFVAGDSSRRIAVKARATPLDLGSFRHHRVLHALLDTLVMPLGPSRALDDPTLRRIVALTNGSSQEDAWIPVGSAPRPGDSLDLALFRQFAVATPLPGLWGYRNGLAGTHSLRTLPGRSLQGVKRLMLANEAAADSLLLAGRAAAALSRARENLASARHFLDQPSTGDLVFGRYVVQRSAGLMNRAALQAGDHTTAATAGKLQRLANESYQVGSGAWVYQDGRDPRAIELIVIASDTLLPPALRLHTAVGAIDGACLNTREVLMGASEDRRELVELIIHAVHDIPRAEELMALNQAMLSRFDTGATDVEAQGAHPRARNSGGMMDRLLPSSVRRRAAYCRAQL
jgi:hypothetical protein